MAEEKLAQAVFAGGCFWCTEAAFDDVAGVTATVSGYIGGTEANANYEAVSTGQTQHFEALLVEYDANKVSYQKLLHVFWDNIDPLDAGGQFSDRGSQYRTAIFYKTEEEKRLAEQSKQALEQKLGQPIATQILPAQAFYAAEDYHQDYHRKNPLQYNMYKKGSGREKRLEELKKIK